MALIVQKFGGTSVGSVERIEQVADKVKKFREAGDDLVVVLSAMSGETNRLIELARQISDQPVPRELDVIVSTGEQVTIALLAMALMKRGVPAVSYTGNQVRILTDSAHNKARILQIDDQKIRTDLKAGRVVVVAGFQGVDEHGNITTLGRGGSDTTGVALAAALKADECQIYTDVDGVYTTDPRVVSQAQRLDKITFEEMLEMASLGSKVLQIRAVEFAGKYNVPLRVLHSFKEGPGTLITIDEEESMEQPIISGIAFNRDEAKLTIRGVPDTPGVAFKILGPISAANIEVDMIVQNVSHDNTTDFTFTIHRNDYQAALQVLEATAREISAREVSGDTKIAKVSIVGVGMRSHAGVASRMFEALAKVLGLEDPPMRLECYDISHSSGEATVASCVVFGPEGPIKSDYRRFNIEGVTAGDDYAAMHQALTRRYSRIKAGEGKLPDVLLVDGGKGQMSMARDVLNELQVPDLILLGVAKGTTRKAGFETLYLNDSAHEFTLPGDSPALHLIQQIRDEAHRFAITGHRARRGKTRRTSTLEGVAGVGPTRRRDLLKHFGGLQELSRASIDEIAKAPGISKKLAESIYANLHSE
ncbi:aspartate kinase [Pseudomonas syringae]|nr:aspartate kinase [Pseudomonas syringae]